MMKKFFAWPFAVLISFVSLVTFLILDYLLSIVWYFIGKIPFLTDIIECVGELLDFGLTALLAIVVVTSIWSFGHSIIKKLYGQPIKFQDSPIFYVNFVFLILFLFMVIFIGYKFAVTIGEVITYYTFEQQGLEKFLLFAKAIKDTIRFIFRENIIICKIGTNSIILFAINTLSDKYID